jgi:hypothetical protein
VIQLLSFKANKVDLLEIESGKSGEAGDHCVGWDRG